jgi:hypothetical protein
MSTGDKENNSKRAEKEAFLAALNRKNKNKKILGLKGESEIKTSSPTSNNVAKRVHRRKSGKD